MKGFYDMQIVVAPVKRSITINAHLETPDDVAEFVTMFNEAQAQVFPAPQDAGSDETEGEAA